MQLGLQFVARVAASFTLGIGLGESSHLNYTTHRRSCWHWQSDIHLHASDRHGFEVLSSSKKTMWLVR